MYESINLFIKRLVKSGASLFYYSKRWLIHAISAFTTDDDQSVHTGGDPEALQDYDLSRDELFYPLYKIRETRQDFFDQVFAGELLDDFFTSAFSTLSYEMNLTPSSVNIYVPYCGIELVKRHMDYLKKLAIRIQAL